MDDPREQPLSELEDIANEILDQASETRSQSHPPKKAPPLQRPAFNPLLAKAARAYREAMEIELRDAYLLADHRVRQKIGAVGWTQLIPSVQVKVKIKPQRGASPIYDAIADRILTSKGATGTQKSIREEVQKAFPSRAVPKDWTKPLPKWAVTKLKARITRMGDPFRSIVLPRKVSFSQLHKLAKAAVQRHHTGAFTAKVTVSLTKNAVTINGESFKVTSNRVGKRDYPMVRISLDKLQEALGCK